MATRAGVRSGSAISHAFSWDGAQGKFVSEQKVDLKASHANAETGFKWAHSVWSEMLG
jgi:hypothetical protein